MKQSDRPSRTNIPWARLMGLVALGFLCTTHFARGRPQDDLLARRGYFGVSLELSDTGPRVFAVAPGSTAASFGVVVGDVIQAIDANATRTPAEVVAAIGRHKGGDALTIDLLRKTGPERLRIILQSYPLEEMTNATVALHKNSFAAECVSDPLPLRGCPPL